MNYANRVNDQQGVRAGIVAPSDYIWVDNSRYDEADFDFSDYRLLSESEAIDLLGSVDAYLDCDRTGCRLFWDSHYEMVCSIGTGNPFRSIEDVLSLRNSNAS